MKLLLVSEQQGKYAKLEGFLQKDLPRFVRSHSSVCLALIKYGMLTSLVDSIPDFHNQGSLPNDFAKRRALLEKGLKWGTPPTIMVMGPEKFLGKKANWWGFYNQTTDSITLYKPLVEQWQKKPTDKILYRAMVVVVLHELVHFFNDQILPGSSVHTNSGHLRNSFHREAFEKSPLSWEPAHHLVPKEVLESKGVK